jgi:hypothetical protein
MFSQIQRPLSMRETRMGKPIYVHGVPSDTSWFCPYCCATVDTAFVALGDTGGGTNALLPCLGDWLLPLSAIPQETYVSGLPQGDVWAASWPSLSLPAEALSELGSRPTHATP